VFGALGVQRRPLLAEERLPPVEVTATRIRFAEPADTTSLGQEELEGGVIEGTKDLGAYAPALNVRVSGDRKSPLIGIRGLSNIAIGDGSVGVYVDDVPLADLRGPLLEFYDVERVDVSRGPQTTTFGRNAEAGAIHVVTPTPDNTLHGGASVRYGNYDSRVYQAAVRGPLVRDVAFLSLAGIKSQRDGYVRNVFRHETLDDRDLLAGRARLVLHPWSPLELSLTGEGGRADDGQTSLVRLDQPDPFRVAYDTPGHQRIDSSLGALTIRWAGPGIELRSTTARRWFDADDSLADLDLTPAPAAAFTDGHHFLESAWRRRIPTLDGAGRRAPTTRTGRSGGSFRCTPERVGRGWSICRMRTSIRKRGRASDARPSGCSPRSS
jgi:iron complex outermembrane receptor protein